jgi:hypothetical protein
MEWLTRVGFRWLQLARRWSAASLARCCRVTFGVRNWRRQTRLDAYVRFLDAAHDFHNTLLQTLPLYGQPSFEEKWLNVLDAQFRIGRAGSLVSIAGPLASVKAVQHVIDRTSAITSDYDNPAIMAQAAKDVVRRGEYKKLVEWIRATDAFQGAARRVLKTEGSLAAQSARERLEEHPPWTPGGRRPTRP